MPRSNAIHSRCYFALPRLLLRLTGGDAERAETNWLEANVVGTAVMFISYLGMRQWLFGGHPPSGARELACFIPLVLLIWIFWLLALYADALLIRLLRAAGLLGGVPNSRAQSTLVLIITTVFAFQLAASGSAVRLVGYGWMTAIVVNFGAHMLLRFCHAN